MQKVVIYILIDPLTNLVRYVGKTKSPSIRFSDHCCDKSNTYKANWIKSLRKQNLKPIMFIIDNVLELEWQFWERHYISLYKSWGFDLTNGSDGGDGNNGIKNLNIISIKCFDFNGVLLNEFKSVKDGSKYYRIKSSHIVDCCRGKIRSYDNKIWRYSDDNFNKFLTQHGKRKSILKFDLNDNFIKEYESITEAAKDVSGQETCISRVLRGLRSKYKNFKWRYK